MSRRVPLFLVPTIVLLAAVAAAAAAPVFELPVPLVMNAPNVDAGASDHHPSAATNGSGTWVVAWDSDDTMHGTIDRDADILFARSTDGGLTFTAPAPLNTNAANDSEFFYSLVIGAHDTLPALAAHGNRFIAVWQRDSHFQYTLALSRSDDGGEHWTPLADLYDRSHSPSIATDGAGTWVIAWRYDSNFAPDDDIFFTRSTDDGLNWSPPSALNTNAVGDTLNDINPHVAWADGVWGVSWTGTFGGFESHVFFARSVDGGTWSAPVELGVGAPSAFNSGITAAGGGSDNWVATWSSGTPNDGGVANVATSRSSDGGLTWTPPAILNGDGAFDGRDDWSTSVAAIDAATYATVWVRQGRDGEPEFDHQDVLSAVSTDGGATWSAPTPLNPVMEAAAASNDLEFGPEIAADSQGHFLALWSSTDRRLASGTAGHDVDIVMSLAGHSCGNGALDPGEGCDDGDRGSLDCCGRTCAFDAAGTVCAADADPCTLERCDGAGGCGHEAAPLDTPCDLDTDLCTNDRCDGNFVCEHVFVPRTSCTASTRPLSSTLKITGGDKRKIAWGWKHGPAIGLNELATYLYGAPYALCVYDGAGLVARVDAPVDASCQGESCWEGTNTSLKYNDRAGTPNGATSGVLKAGKETNLKLRGGGANFGTPALPPTGLPVHAQLISDEKSKCFGATYSSAGVQTNTAGQFKAKSD